MSNSDEEEAIQKILDMESSDTNTNLDAEISILKKELINEKKENKELSFLLKKSQDRAIEAQGKTIEIQEKLERLYKVNETLLNTIDNLKITNNSKKENKAIEVKSEEPSKKIEQEEKPSSSEIKEDVKKENIFNDEKEVESYILYIRNNKSKMRLSGLIEDEIKRNGARQFQYLDSNVVQCFNMKWIITNLETLFMECCKIVFQNIPTLKITEELCINSDVVLESTNGTILNIVENGVLMIDGEVKVKIINFQMIECHHNLTQSCIQIHNKGYLVFEKAKFINNIGERPIIRVHPKSTLEIFKSCFDGNKRVENGPVCIYFEKESILILKRCDFINHQAFDKIYQKSDDIISGSGNLNIFECYFENYNSEYSDFPMIVSSGDGSAFITNSTFKKNSCIEFSENKKVYIYNCLFEENGKEERYSGAIYLMDNTDAMITNCHFLNNFSHSGGAINATDRSKLKMISCTLQGNKSLNGGGYGGAINLRYSAHAKIFDCLIKDNWAKQLGGAIAINENSIAEVVKCLFENNMCYSNTGHVILSHKRSGFIDIESKYTNYNQKRDIYIMEKRR